MAELKNRFFGEVTGAFGDVVYRVRKGKNFTARKPRKYKKQKTDESIKRSNAFKMSIKYASMINSIPELRSFIKAGLITDQSPYEYLLSTCMKSLFGKPTIERVPITLDSGFGVEVSESTFDGTTFTLTTEPLLGSSLVDTSIEKKFRLISLLQSTEPEAEGEKPYAFIKLKSESIPSSVEDSLEFTIRLSTAEKQLLQLYKTYVINSTIITYDENDNPIRYANTFYTTLPKP
jgi:hypothetical protein